jgi:hypothetical protein
MAVVTDNSGVTTTSSPIDVTITNPPTVTISSPSNGASFASSSNIDITAIAQDDDVLIDNVDFYADGNLLGTGFLSVSNQYMFKWVNVPDGVHSVTAVAKDKYGVTGTSNPCALLVNRTSVSPGEFLWFDDSVPQGATTHSDSDGWYWIDANPAPVLGNKSHQSKTGSGVHQHFFDGATDKLIINAGDKLYTYVFLDLDNMPRELMLQWQAEDGWEHRAFWGADAIDFGLTNSNGRRRIGSLPAAGQWVRLEVPASDVGLEGKTVSGMAFTLDGGRATWDHSGKLVPSLVPPPPATPSDQVWVDDAVPAGATVGVTDDVWNWVNANPAPYSGQKAHQSYVASSSDPIQFRQHYFTGAQTPLEINPGDVLYAYVYLDPTYKPDEIMLQWYDGAGWEHRAYWGGNWIQQFGIHGTESRRYMGGLPSAGKWVRLEAPASYVGLEGKTVTGMSFGLYRDQGRGLATWDKAGKVSSSSSLTVPVPLQATVLFYRFFGSDYNGYYYTTNSIGRKNEELQRIQCYIFANQAAGTVPFYRFRSKDFNRYFYSTNFNEPDPSAWSYEGIAGYLYPDNSAAGTVPLYRFRGQNGHFYTTDASEGTDMISEGVAGYVIQTQPPPSLTAPTNLVANFTATGFLTWSDNSSNETGFKIESGQLNANWLPVNWTQIATVGPNTTSFKIGNPHMGTPYRVRAMNDIGNSSYSNVVYALGREVYESGGTPEVSITVPENGAVVVGNEVTISTSVYDANGTVDKVELFEGNNKIGEVAASPYVFIWGNVTPGAYTLTAKITDGLTGATVISSPVTITVYRFR